MFITFLVVIAIVALIFSVAFVIGRITAPRITWTDLEVDRKSPRATHQDTFYKVLEVDGERFYFTVEQVNVARTRAEAYEG
jgi:hypothetical protein